MGFGLHFVPFEFPCLHTMLETHWDTTVSVNYACFHLNILAKKRNLSNCFWCVHALLLLWIDSTRLDSTISFKIVFFVAFAWALSIHLSVNFVWCESEWAHAWIWVSVCECLYEALDNTLLLHPIRFSLYLPILCAPHIWLWCIFLSLT